MSRSKPKLKNPEVPLKGLPKSLTGIHGLDELTLGGLPQGRTTLVCGSAGCGKTVLGIEFLVHGAKEFNEPGVCLSFEETAEELTSNVESLGFDIGALIARKKLVVDHINVDRSLIEEAGEYDLEALFIRLSHAVDSIGARRVMLDGIEALFAGLQNESVLRAELRRLFRWLKDKNLTAIVTGERGTGELTRHGLEEYISDCVIFLDHRVSETVLTRRLRIVKYRGSLHGTNEYPFLIETDGLSVLPLTSIDLKHAASEDRVSTGIPALDEMFGGDGYFRGSSIIISGTAGTGKTSLSAHFVDAACARGERCVFFSFEESSDQIVRNMRSIGVDLGRWIDKGTLNIHSARPTTFGLEMHLVKMHRIIQQMDPSIVVVDPVTALLYSGAHSDAQSMLLRLIDFLKSKRITALMTTLTSGAEALEQTAVNISSLVDAWLLVRDIESGGERNRGLYILKARGLAHSNQIREFRLTDHGVELRDVYQGGTGLLTGAAREIQESKDQSEVEHARQAIENKQSVIDRKRKAVEAQMAALRLDLDIEEQELQQLIARQVRMITRQERSDSKGEGERMHDAIAARTPPAGTRGNAPKRRGKQ